MQANYRISGHGMSVPVSPEIKQLIQEAVRQQFTDLRAFSLESGVPRNSIRALLSGKDFSQETWHEDGMIERLLRTLGLAGLPPIESSSSAGQFRPYRLERGWGLAQLAELSQIGLKRLYYLETDAVSPTKEEWDRIWTAINAYRPINWGHEPYGLYPAIEKEKDMATGSSAVDETQQSGQEGGQSDSDSTLMGPYLDDQPYVGETPDQDARVHRLIMAAYRLAKSKMLDHGHLAIAAIVLDEDQTILDLAQERLDRVMEECFSDALPPVGAKPGLYALLLQQAAEA